MRQFAEIFVLMWKRFHRSKMTSFVECFALFTLLLRWHTKTLRWMIEKLAFTRFCLWIEMLYLNNDYFTCRSIHAAQVNDVWMCKKWQESSSWIISHCKHAAIFMCWVNQKCIARHKVRHNRFETLEMKRQIDKCRCLVTI